MANEFYEIKHPVLQHKLTLLRDVNTNSRAFRDIMNEIGRFLAYESTKELPTKQMEVTTPIEATTADYIEKYPIVVSVLRAGNGLLDGVLDTLPFSAVGFVGMYRDKFINNTVEYYFKLPEKCDGRDILLLDPMLATGDTAIAAIDRLKQYGVGKITMLTVLVSPEGLERLHHFHPDVIIYTVSKEKGLNEKGYLLPGLGDAGDRLYSTK
ncbi:uracil phosphoribosyltransferase [Halobacteriovorax marinus]|uniref:Uracil phosphoribosyltransferase n=1 Tax=Halobacteriovorax marinus TaxID=97084 RepID=A0A1Y5FAG5_9BACT|nr:uracil phosphoribosyltransferase [Halobacteriovorax marinus]